MSNENAAVRAQILSEIMSVVQQNNMTGEINLGELVLFLEGELLKNLDDRILNLKLLWKFCKERTLWSRQLFIEMFQPLKERLAPMQVMVVMPRMTWREASSASLPALPPQALELLQSLIVTFVEAIYQSPMRDVINPSQIDTLLIDYVAGFHAKQVVDLEPVWQRFLDLPGASEESLTPMFEFIKGKEESLGLEVLLPEALISQELDVDVEGLRAQLLSQPGMTEEVVEMMLGTMLQKKEEEAAERTARRMESRIDLSAVVPPGEVASMGASPVSLGSGGPDPVDMYKVLETILECVQQTPVESIIDPSKLRGYLEDELSGMWDGDAFQLQPIWDILLDAPGIVEDMLLQMFLLLEMRQELLPVKIWVPVQVSGLSAEAKRSLLPQYSSPVPAIATPSGAFLGAPNAGAYSMPGGGVSETLGGGYGSPAGYHGSPAATSTSTSSRVETTRSRSSRETKKPKKEKKPKKAKKERKKQKFSPPKDASANQGRLKLLGVLLLFFLIFAFYMFSSSSQSFGGNRVDANAFTKYIPVDDVRIDGKIFKAKVSQKFMDMPQDKRFENVHMFMQEARKRYRAKRIMFFEPSGKFMMVID